MPNDYLEYLRDAQKRLISSQNALDSLSEKLKFDLRAGTKPPSNETTEFQKNDIYDGLEKISPILANSYAQVKIDMLDTERISWAGTAHEIRQIVVTLLNVLAPDDRVKAEPNFKLEQNATGPTHKQKVVFILKQRGAGSKVQEVVEKVGKFDDLIGDIVRGFYSRASDAAHRSKDKKETNRLLQYFEVFVRDLLDLE